jgi:hypothetical protein
MSNILRLMAALVLLAFADNSRAANVNPMPFEQQVVEADLVVLARTSAAARIGPPRFDATGSDQLTEMEVLQVLKGDSSIRSIDFVTRGSMVEADPNCCQADRIYILLLRRSETQNIYAVVNGRDSVILVN